MADTEAEATEAEEAVEAPPAERHGVPVVAGPRGQTCSSRRADDYLEVVEALRDEGFAMCVDVTAVDYLTHPGRSLPDGVAPERFEVVVNLLSLERRERVRVRVQVPRGRPDGAVAVRRLPRHRGARARGRTTCSASPSTATPT